MLEGGVILSSLQIFLLTESKSAKVLTLALIIYKIALSSSLMKKELANYWLNKTCGDYNLIADDFSRTRSKAWEEAAFLFENYLTPGERVLDLGCGNGRHYKFFENKDIQYIGIDNSEKLIKIAEEKYPKADFRKEDALNLSFPNNYFDKVYSIAVLHHIPSEKLRIKFLLQTKRVLKQNGKLVLTVWKFHNKKEQLLLLKYTILKIIGKNKMDFKDILEPWGKKTKTVSITIT